MKSHMRLKSLHVLRSRTRVARLETASSMGRRTCTCEDVLLNICAAIRGRRVLLACKSSRSLKLRVLRRFTGEKSC